MSLQDMADYVRLGVNSFWRPIDLASEMMCKMSIYSGFVCQSILTTIPAVNSLILDVLGCLSVCHMCFSHEKYCYWSCIYCNNCLRNM